MSKIIVGSIVRNEIDRRVGDWLENVQTYCDKHIIIDDASDDGTTELLRIYAGLNKNVILIEGKVSKFTEQESTLRDNLWEHIRDVAKEEDDDWVLIADADEFYSEEDAKEMVKFCGSAKKDDYDVAAIRLLDMWNETQYRVDGYWSPYFHRLFRYKNKPFCKKLKDGLHLPAIPEYASKTKDVYMSDIRCQHFSYHTEQLRKNKYDYYIKNVKDNFNLNHAKTIIQTAELKNVNTELPTILITSLIHNREWILDDFLNCLSNIDYPINKLKFYFIINNSTDDSIKYLKEWCNDKDAVISEYNFPLPSKKEHSWTDSLLQHMAAMRNNTLDIARQLDCDYMINIDSDILFTEGVIKHLVTCDKKIISPVFWAGWGTDKKLPQVWERGGYEISDSFINMLKTYRAIFKVGGMGAFSCIHKSVWEKGVNYSKVYNLPSDVRGEDRDFCIRATTHGFNLWASTYCDMIHMDSPEMLKEYKLYQNLKW